MSACFEKASAAEQKRLADALAQNEKQKKIETEKPPQGQYAAAEIGADDLRKSLQQERERASRLEQDLAAARRDVETQTALASQANDEASKLKASESSAAELRTSLQQEHDKNEVLALELSRARAEIYAYEAQAHKAPDEAADLEQAEVGTDGLRKSLQQEQERARRLEQDLAAARRDVETQTALAVKANEDAARSKQVAEHDSAELQRALQKERERAEGLAQNLSLVHTAIYAYEVQARMASDLAVARAQSAASSAAGLRKSLQKEQERSAQLQQDLVASRREVETQTALAAKAGAEVARLKQAVDDGAAESFRSLTAQDKQPGADAIRPVAATQTFGAATRSNAKPNPEDAADVARLLARASVLLGQGDIGSARIVLERAAETGNVQASFTLAETYDPLVLRKWGAYGTLGDAAKARDLYAKAQAGGITEARDRFDALRR